MRRKSLVTGALGALVGIVAMFAAEAPAAATPGDGVVSGTVVVPGGHAVTGVDLYLASASGDAVVAGPVNPDAGGVYQFTGVADGSYTVFAETPADTLAWQWSGAGRDASEADAVTIADGSTAAGVDFALVAGASISGTVTVPSGYAPEDSGAFADRPAGAAAVAPPGTVTAGGQYANAAGDGTYSIGNLPDLTWLVRFPTAGAALATQYYNGVYTEAAATPVSPSVGQAVTGIDANLVTSSLLVVSGTFKNAGSSLCYSVRNADSSVTRSGCSTAGVAQATEVVPPGSYIVSAWESNAAHGDTAHLWWNNTAADRKVEANATGFTPSAITADPLLETTFNFTSLRFPDDPPPPPSGSISLTLSNFVGGTAASGGCMKVYNSSQVLVKSDCVGASGTYTVGSLPDGTYRVALTSFTGAAITQWYANSDTFQGATPVTIAGDTAFVASYRLLQRYSVTGVVVDGDGNPRAGLTVILWSPLYQAGGYTEIERLVTDASGRFVSGDVGPYPHVWVKAPDGIADYFGPTVYNTGSTPKVMSPIVIDDPEGTITGLLDAPANFQSDVVCVFAYQAVYYGNAVGSACGQRGAPFEIHHLQAGTYTLRFIDSGDPLRLPFATSAWSGYGASMAGLTDSSRVDYVRATVTVGAATPVTFTWGGVLRATPTVGSGTLTGGCIDVYLRNDGPLIGTDCEPMGGVFEVSVPYDDWFTVHYRDFVGGFNRWHSNADSRTYAQSIVVRHGLTTAVTTTLIPWGRFTGTIAVPAGVAPGDACMFAASADGADFFGEACVDPVSGLYSLSAPPGAYRLQFFTQSPDGATEWFDDSPAFADARTVTMSANTVTVNASLSVAASVSGVITLPGGAPARDACVHLYELDGDAIDETCVDAAGRYVLGSLPAGTYALYTSGFNGWAGEWYAGGSVLSQATPLVVTAGASITADAQLGPVGTVSGIVTGSGPGAALGGCVSAYDADGHWYDETCVDGAGRFAITVAPGAYRLLFHGFRDASGRALASEWSGDGRSLDTASRITVAGGGLTSANATLALGGRLVGTTRVLGGAELALGGCAQVRELETAALIDFACADSSGGYEFHLRPGQYLLTFLGFEGASGTALATTWYGAVATSALATPVSVGVGVTTTVAASDVARAGSVYGTIVLPAGAAMDGFVEVYDGTSGDYITSVSPARDGSFRIEDLATNRDLRVRFVGFTGAANLWNGGSTSFAAAYQVWPIAAGRDIGTVSLGVAARIQGRLPYFASAGGAEPCVVAWLTDGNFFAESCGVAGEPFSIDHVPASAYYLQGYVGDRHVGWYTPSSGWHDGSLGASDAFWVAPGATYQVGPTLTLTGPSSVMWGTTATYTVSVDPSFSGVASLQYSRPGGAWTTSAKTVTVTSGAGSFTLTPVDPKVTYRIVVRGSTSNAIPVSAVVPVVTLTGPSSVMWGTTATYTVSVDPSFSGVASLQYSRPGGAWTTSTKTVPVTNGAGTFTLTPVDPMVTYRVVIAGATSNAIGVAAVAPTVALTGPSSVVWGTTTTYTVAVSSPINGVAALQYSRPGGAWTTSTKTVPVTNGAGTFTLTPVDPMVTYRVVIAGSTSNAIGVAAVAPTVTLSGPTSVVWGTTTTYTVAVSSPISGVASLQYARPGGAWTTSAKTVTVTNGAGTFTLTPVDPMVTYRVVIAGSTSNAIGVAAVAPTVTLTGPSSVVWGTTRTYTVAVSSPISGVASLQYARPGGAWTTSAKTVTVTNGAGTFTLTPVDPMVTYRVVIAGSTSNAIPVAAAR